MRIIARHMQPRLEEALDNFRVVMLHGARQCGKSTLARLVAAQRGGTYTSLDNEATRQAAAADPRGFLLDQAHPLVIDEVQLGGDRIVREIKQAVDANPAAGRFLLTGSTNFLTVPTISESLAGRVRLLQLWTLSEAELEGTTPPTLESWFDHRSDTPTRPNLSHQRSASRHDYLELVCRGGYPEIAALDLGVRAGWFDSYAATVIERDVVALGDLRRRTVLPVLLEWVAANTSGELNVQSAASRLGVDRVTFNSYLTWLETVFLVHRLPSWSRNPSARTVRRPKIHLSDTGLAASLMGVDAAALSAPTAPARGALLESFVVNEIARCLSTSASRLRMYHYRDHRSHEVDLVIERADGAVVAAEIKATSSPNVQQLRHIAWLRDHLDVVSPGAFRAGILFHTGDQRFTLGDRLHLRPINTLWTSNP